MNFDVRSIAFYLPQFHPVPENDEWWGQGFTEWRNVTTARPLFPDHYQPHLPADLGFYDLRLEEARIAQAELARQYGIHGFCYYHYWFNGRRILERPFNEVLQSGKPDFPFCLCWANENWTRVWDGGDRDILLEQRYSLQDDLNHIRSLIPAFRDSRYIKIHGKPLFLVYRSELLPDPAKTAALWKHEAQQAGFPGLYLVRVENFERGIDPTVVGFDAAVEFAPDTSRSGAPLFQSAIATLLGKLSLLPRGVRANRVYSYRAMVHSMLSKPEPTYTWFRCVSPTWDNSARRRTNANIFVGSSPSIYQDWLERIAKRTRERYPEDERLVFINAWNEWAEGCHLEPDQRWGRAYLEATKAALSSAPLAGTTSSADTTPSGADRIWQTAKSKVYWPLVQSLAESQTLLGAVAWHLKHRLPPR